MWKPLTRRAISPEMIFVQKYDNMITTVTKRNVIWYKSTEMFVYR